LLWRQCKHETDGLLTKQTTTILTSGHRYIYNLIVGLFFSLCSFGQTNTTGKTIQCDDSLWNHIYKSYRLEIIEKCKRGTVVEARFEADGDAHILLKVDKGQEYLLNDMNYEKQRGLLVIEPVCATLIDNKNPEVECEGFVNNVYLPRVDEHVEIIGSFVLDTKHSWNEIHPVTSIKPSKN
jgi:hypothetical protein